MSFLAPTLFAIFVSAFGATYFGILGIVIVLLAGLLLMIPLLLIGGMVWPAGLWVVPALALVVSLASALLPTVAAYRVSVLRLLQSH